MTLADTPTEAVLRLACAGEGQGAVTCGVPWPRGALRSPDHLILRNHQGQFISLQTRVLDRWSDGSVRWLLLDWQGNAGSYRLTVVDHAVVTESALKAARLGDKITINNGHADFELGIGDRFPFQSVRLGGKSIIDETHTRFLVESESGKVFHPVTDSIEIEEAGPVRVLVHCRGAASFA